MKKFKTVFNRPNTSIAFPATMDGAVVAHVQANYTQSDPVKLVGMSSEISDDLLSLIITRTFATDADALAFSQDPVIVAWQASQAETFAGTGVVRESGLSD